MKDNNIMIFGNSNHPIEIKKISLRMWKLRDEIEQLIADAYKESDPVQRQAQLDLIEKTYSSLNRPMAEVISMKEHLDQKIEENPKEEVAAEESLPDEVKIEDQPTKAEETNLIQILPPSSQLPDDKVSEGVCLLVDITMDSILFFSKDFFIEGQTIVLEFGIPAKFNVVAEVTRSINYNLKSRIISKHRPDYRMAAKLKLIRPGDRALMRKFLASIEPDVPTSAPKASPKKENNDFDDFDLA